MAKEFEQKVLQALNTLQKDIGGLRQDMGGVQKTVGGLENNVSGLEQNVGGLEKNVSGLKQNVGGIEKSVNGLVKSVNGLEQSVGALELSVGALEKNTDGLLQRMDRLEVLHEETADKIDTIVEIVGTQRDHMTKLATKDDISDVRTDISTIQKAVKATNKDLKGKLFFQPAQAA